MSEAERRRLARALIWGAFDGGPPQDLAELERLERHYLAIVDAALAQPTKPVGDE